jgi:lipoprotein NlpI
MATAAAAQSPQAVLDRAIADFEAGRVTESANGFDQVVKLVPLLAPRLWQRGIALYYAGRYGDCRSQFESHRTVNPNDVENAAWHYACVARLESPAKARAAILPVGPDPRVPMKEIYEMFAGRLSPEAMIKSGGNTAAGQFYAQLYAGLYYEAQGDAARARQHITAAAADRFAQAGGYMHSVAKVHAGRLPPAR